MKNQYHVPLKENFVLCFFLLHCFACSQCQCPFISSVILCKLSLQAPCPPPHTLTTTAPLRLGPQRWMKCCVIYKEIACDPRALLQTGLGPGWCKEETRSLLKVLDALRDRTQLSLRPGQISSSVSPRIQELVMSFCTLPLPNWTGKKDAELQVWQFNLLELMPSLEKHLNIRDPLYAYWVENYSFSYNM